ncbi:MAG: hypothetical protein GY938_24460 [Ketobacter sp.]|nr:hypothetical protein [Ketobacter sp.]
MSLPVKRVWIQVGDNHLSVIESDGEIVLQTEGGMVIRPMSGNQVVINSEG